MEECNYVNGVKHGKATYYWKAGHKEEFLYEKVGKILIQSALYIHCYKIINLSFSNTKTRPKFYIYIYEYLSATPL